MNIIVSVLAGQGVVRLLEIAGVTNPIVEVCVAALSTGFTSIGLFVWREKK